MKKIVFCFLFFVLFFGCKMPTPTSQGAYQQLEVEKPIVFKESLRPNVLVKDSLYFYNSLQINLEGVYNKEPITIIKDHKEYVYDSSITIRRIVPAMTAGYLRLIGRNSDGKIDYFSVTFSKLDTTYTLYFVREDILDTKRNNEQKSSFIYDKESFILAAKAYIYFKGEEFKVRASEVVFAKKVINKETKKPEEKIEPCRLLYYRTMQNSSSEDVKTAEGWDKKTPTPITPQPVPIQGQQIEDDFN